MISPSSPRTISPLFVSWHCSGRLAPSSSWLEAWVSSAGTDLVRVEDSCWRWTSSALSAASCISSLCSLSAKF